MTFPAGLTLVTVACQFDLPPSGGAAGMVRLTYSEPLNGPTDDSVVPYIDETASLDSAGHCSIVVPATNDPDWTPQNFVYTVRVTLPNQSVKRGMLQLDYQSTSVNLADLVQWNGTITPGQTYVPLSYLATLQSPAVSGITRDSQGRVTGYTEAGQVWSAITYDASGLVSAFTVDGRVYAVSRNAAGQITGVA